MNRFSFKDFLISLLTQLIIVIPVLIIAITSFNSEKPSTDGITPADFSTIRIQSQGDSNKLQKSQTQDHFILILESYLNDGEKILWIKKLPKEDKPSDKRLSDSSKDSDSALAVGDLILSHL